jgi:hypothetical protein
MQNTLGQYKVVPVVNRQITIFIINQILQVMQYYGEYVNNINYD